MSDHLLSELFPRFVKKSQLEHLAKGPFGEGLLEKQGKRVYLKPGEQAPEGANVQTGARGGKYYDDMGGASSQQVIDDARAGRTGSDIDYDESGPTFDGQGNIQLPGYDPMSVTELLVTGDIDSEGMSLLNEEWQKAGGYGDMDDLLSGYDGPLTEARVQDYLVDQQRQAGFDREFGNVGPSDDDIASATDFIGWLEDQAGSGAYDQARREYDKIASDGGGAGAGEGQPFPAEAYDQAMDAEVDAWNPQGLDYGDPERDAQTWGFDDPERAAQVREGLGVPPKRTHRTPMADAASGLETDYGKPSDEAVATDEDGFPVGSSPTGEERRAKREGAVANLGQQQAEEEALDAQRQASRSTLEAQPEDEYGQITRAKSHHPVGRADAAREEMAKRKEFQNQMAEKQGRPPGWVDEYGYPKDYLGQEERASSIREYDKIASDEAKYLKAQEDVEALVDDYAGSPNWDSRDPHGLEGGIESAVFDMARATFDSPESLPSTMVDYLVQHGEKIASDRKLADEAAEYHGAAGPPGAAGQTSPPDVSEPNLQTLDSPDGLNWEQSGFDQEDFHEAVIEAQGSVHEPEMAYSGAQNWMEENGIDINSPLGGKLFDYADVYARERAQESADYYGEDYALMEKMMQKYNIDNRRRDPIVLSNKGGRQR